MVQIIGARELYKGKYLGSFPPASAHQVRGRVYAASEDTLYIEGFSYDGSAPDAFFWAGNTPLPSANGFIIPDSLGRQVRLNAYNNQNVILKLPDGRKIKDIRWIAVWCRLYTVNFGHVMIPFNFDAPKEIDLGRLPNFAHGTHARAVIIKDAKTIHIKRLFYDGAAPDAFFLVGTGENPHAYGTKVPDENGSLRKIHGYNGQDVTLRLPGNLTVFDIDWFALYCITYTENFGHVKIPKNLNVPADLQALASTVIVFSNCETIFPDTMQVSWEVRHPHIYIQLEGIVARDHYLSFGLSGSHERPQMIGADVAVAFFDSKTNRAIVDDYILTAKAQCAPQSNSGACPDTRISGGKQDTELISWSYNDGILNVVYKRKLETGDDSADQLIVPDIKATIVAAIGPINSLREAAYHNIKWTHATDTPIRIAFARREQERNCKPLVTSNLKTESSSSQLRASGWEPSVIKGERVFRAQIGPTGGSRGYTAITGIQSWGVAWWINGKLIPELHVERGKDYTFIVEGGNNPAIQASYHPLYITNNKEGGGAQFPDALNSSDHIIYAGVLLNGGKPDPSPGAGRYCEWKHKSGIDRAEDVATFEEYKQTLTLRCDPGDPAVFVWRPDQNTPDQVYYQCFTHRNLGWKIIVDGSHLIKPSTLLLLLFLFIAYILS
ncbi:Protein Skeletor:-like isoforms D/E [Dinothrombium tinctorium]|uniref:Protein Skeletor:-like isoforms D/E n=1 Tax=Dinothrombium tinctorium TaxID=1965070 RepID=A0A443QWF1_9ACAR|nr:Protein Skeletor:-like isoforms D/E [Dinothrombium tinctorium]